ncbi:MAG: Gfo/Idh/MocA family oxidoreductase [Planctomycetaceae bacterium]|nr:Gfo/Idh/MocA family oxidoreductase [Planctomycetaceae bacterium]
MTQPASSRREFLKTSSLLAAGGAALGSLSLARGVHAGADDTIKVGLIGCGGRGTGAAAQALHTTGPVKLVAVGDAFQDRVDRCMHELEKDAEIKDRLDVPVERRFVGLDCYKNVIDAGVDLVILATPPGFRPIHLAAAVEAGKHVFMEKPVAVDAPGVRSVLESAQKAKQKGLGLGVGLQRHHQAEYLETIKRLQDGAIGDIVNTRVYWNGAGVWVHPRTPDQSEMQYQVRNWYYFNWLCGDHIVEQHIHNLDVSNWLKGAYPVRCQGLGGRQVRTGSEFGEIYDHFACEYEYADGTRMFSYCRHIPNCWDSVSEHAQGTKGTADISGSLIKPTGGETWKYRGKRANPYQVEHDDLFASIRAGNPLNEGENGALSSMTAILGRMAVYSGKMLKWEDALNSKISLAPAEYTWEATPPVPTIAVPGQTAVV